jgi:hypothetical protein
VTDREPGRLRRRLLLAAAAPLLLLLWSWVAGALIFFESWPRTVGVMGVIAWALLPALAAWRLDPKRALACCALLGVAWAIAFFALQRPRPERAWATDMARTAEVELSPDGRGLVVKGVRNSARPGRDDQQVRWEKRSYDLGAVCCVDFIIEPLPALPGMAHALLSFGFDDGERLVVSAEIRREAGESYSPIAGVFRRYELVYVVGDERDLLGLRLDARGHELRIHPLRVEREHAAALLRSMLLRADELGRKPEFYNSITNNCTTSLVRHLDELREDDLPFAWQVHLPLHADEVAWELGLIRDGSTLAEARGLHRVTGPGPPEGTEGAEYSRLLRERR